MTAAQLPALLKRLWPRGRVVNASLAPSGLTADSRAVFDRLRLPKAEFWDLRRLHDPSAPYPNTLLQPYGLVDFVVEQQLRNRDTFLLYDDFGLLGAARLFWILALMGKDARVINARLQDLQQAGVALTSEPLAPRKVHRNVDLMRFFFRSKFLADYEEMVMMVRQNAISPRGNCIIDARSPQAFNALGTDGQPAHIPGSHNLFYRELLTPAGLLRPEEELRQCFQPLPLAEARRLVVTCGSGMTACVLFLALRALGHHNVALYDGSWAEYSARTKA